MPTGSLITQGLLRFFLLGGHDGFDVVCNELDHMISVDPVERLAKCSSGTTPRCRERSPEAAPLRYASPNRTIAKEDHEKHADESDQDCDDRDSRRGHDSECA